MTGGNIYKATPNEEGDYSGLDTTCSSIPAGSGTQHSFTACGSLTKRNSEAGTINCAEKEVASEDSTAPANGVKRKQIAVSNTQGMRSGL